MKKTLKISILVAVSKNGAIGKDGKLPWHLSEDLKRFKALTTNHPIIMGRKTWESIGSKPLPNRTNIVLSRRVGKMYNDPNCLFVSGWEAALDLASKYESGKKGGEVFVIGGEQIYEQALPFADRIYLTLVEKEIDGDTFFPDYSEFKKIISEETNSEGELKYSFLTLEK